MSNLVELIGLPLLLPLSAEEKLVKAIPPSYSKAFEHLINAQIEALKSAKAVLESRIERLENLKQSLATSEAAKVKEKVKVE